MRTTVQPGHADGLQDHQGRGDRIGREERVVQAWTCPMESSSVRPGRLRLRCDHRIVLTAFAIAGGRTVGRDRSASDLRGNFRKGSRLAPMHEDQTGHRRAEAAVQPADPGPDAVGREVVEEVAGQCQRPRRERTTRFRCCAGRPWHLAQVKRQPCGTWPAASAPKTNNAANDARPCSRISQRFESARAGCRRRDVVDRQPGNAAQASSTLPDT